MSAAKNVAIKLLLAALCVIAGSRLEIGLQQSDLTPKICIAESSYYLDSQTASAKEFKLASKKQ